MSVFSRPVANPRDNLYTVFKKFNLLLSLPFSPSLSLSFSFNLFFSFLPFFSFSFSPSYSLSLSSNLQLFEKNNKSNLDNKYLSNAKRVSFPLPFPFRVTEPINSSLPRKVYSRHVYTRIVYNGGEAAG